MPDFRGYNCVEGVSRSAEGGGGALLVIGLTGGIASGKSTVARWLAEAGAPVIDADRVAREVTRPGRPAWREVVAAFGAGVTAPDGTLDRAALARVVFSDPEALARLNRATHPHIIRAIRRRLALLRRRGVRVAVVELPLLFEGGWEDLVDEVWVVAAGERVQRERLLARGLSPEEAARRLAAQLPLTEKVKRADVVLDGEAPPAEARRRAVELYRAALERAGSAEPR